MYLRPFILVSASVVSQEIESKKVKTSLYLIC